MSSFLIDIDADVATHDKTFIGDVETFTCCQLICPRISVKKTGPDHTYTGTNVQYEISICNNSDLPVNGLVVTENYPAGFTHTVTTPTPFPPILNLNPGETLDFVVNGHYTTAGTSYINCVTVYDPLCDMTVEDCHEIEVPATCPAHWTNPIIECTDITSCVSSAVFFHNKIGQDIVQHDFSLLYDPAMSNLAHLDHR